MALVRCSECGREISDTAMSCPHCGFYRGLKCKDCWHWVSAKGYYRYCENNVQYASEHHPASEQFKKQSNR